MDDWLPHITVITSFSMAHVSYFGDVKHSVHGEVHGTYRVLLPAEKKAGTFPVGHFRGVHDCAIHVRNISRIRRQQQSDTFRETYWVFSPNFPVRFHGQSGGRST